MKLIPIRQYNKATATVALLLSMASSFSSLTVSADQYRHLAEDGSDQVTTLDSGKKPVTALDTVTATESGSEEVAATEQASSEIKATDLEAADLEAADVEATDVEATDLEATDLEATELEIDEAGTQAADLDEVAATDYIYVVVEDPHATDPPVLPPTGKGAVEEYYYYYVKGGKSMMSKSKSKKHKSSKHHSYYDDGYYVDDTYYGKGKGKGKGGDYYYHVETMIPEAPTDAPAHSEDPSVDEPDPSHPPEEEGQATVMPTTLLSIVSKGKGYYVEYDYGYGKGYKMSKHKKSHDHYHDEYYYTEPEETEYIYVEPEYVYVEPEYVYVEPEYVEEMPEHIFQKPVYHYPVYRSKSMMSSSKSMKSSSTKGAEMPPSKGKGYYPVAPPTTSKGKGYYPVPPPKGKGKGAYPSPTPATKHTPAPHRSTSQDVEEPAESTVPPTLVPATIPQQSIPAGADVTTSGGDSTGETITMADYWLSYELTSTDAPTSAMQLELEKVTADYVKNFFESNFAMSSVIHFTGATTSLLSSTYPEYPTPPAKVRFQTALDFAASSGHPQVSESESGPSQYDDALRIAFEGDNAKSYLHIVNLLPDGNVYRTATSVSFEHEPFTEQTAKTVTVPPPTLSTNTITETTAGLPGAPNANTSTTTTSGINSAGIAAAAGAGFFVLLAAGLVVYRNKRSEEDGRVSKYLSEDDCGHITVAEETYTGASSNDSQSCIHQSSPSRDYGRSLVGLPSTEEENIGREHSSSVDDQVSDKGDDDESSEDSCSCVLEDEEV